MQELCDKGLRKPRQRPNQMLLNGSNDEICPCKDTKLCWNRRKYRLPDDKILDWSKLIQSAGDNFEFDGNGIKFSKLVENTVGKGEITLYEQFLLFPQCFQKVCFPGASKGVIVWE